jgi:hypothetical protein
MKHSKWPFHILALVVMAFGVGLALSGGPVIWAVLVMLSPPLLIVWMLGESRRSGPNPHFAPPPEPRHAKPISKVEPPA